MKHALVLLLACLALAAATNTEAEISSLKQLLERSLTAEQRELLIHKVKQATRDLEEEEAAPAEEEVDPEAAPAEEEVDPEAVPAEEEVDEEEEEPVVPDDEAGEEVSAEDEQSAEDSTEEDDGVEEEIKPDYKPLPKPPPRPQENDDVVEHLDHVPNRGLPYSMLSFVLASQSMKVAPIDAPALMEGQDKFSKELKKVIRALRLTANDVRLSSSLHEAAEGLNHDLQELAETFLPAVRDASAIFMRTILYGIVNSEVCDLNSKHVYECIEDQLEDLGELFRHPEDLDKDITRLESCENFQQNSLGGKRAVASDIDCIADRISALQNSIDDLKDSASEQQLANLLDKKPLPNFPGDLRGVAAKVKSDVATEMKRIMSLALRIMNDTGDLQEALMNEE